MKVSCTNNIISKNDEKIVLIVLIGILETLKRNTLSIDEAEKFLFSPRTVARLKKIKCDEKIIDILERGCELEDIESLIPDELLENISILETEVLELLNNYSDYNGENWLEW